MQFLKFSINLDMKLTLKITFDREKRDVRYTIVQFFVATCTLTSAP